MGYTIIEAAVAVFTVWLFKLTLQKVLDIRSKQHVLNLPRWCLAMVAPISSFALGALFPFKGQMGYYFARFSPYTEYGSTCLSSIIFWNALPMFWLSDAEAIKAVNTDQIHFRKDVDAYKPSNIYGPNIIAIEGSDWKRHRAVANSAFNEANNALVWRETVRVVHEWFDEIDGPSEMDDNVNLTEIALLVISSAGFGRHVSMKDDSKAGPPPGHKLAFKPAVTTALRLIILKALTPTWVYDLSASIYLPCITPALDKTRTSFEALGGHMLELISLARAWIADGKTTSMDAALLRNLVEANMSYDGVSDSRYLSDDELLSDTFAYLVAGHETAAGALSFAVTLLALYPDVQHRLYEEACGLWPDRLPPLHSPPPYKESISSLVYTTAVFHEALRLFPPVVRLSKKVLTDTHIKARRFATSHDGRVLDVKEYIVPIEGGSTIIIDIAALHMNPIHWGDDVAEFKPERFIDTEVYRWPCDAFNAFSSGARSCIGQRFAVIEGVCVLAHLTRRYEILLPKDLEAKSFEEQKRILLKWKPDPSAKPKDARVRLRLRL